MLFKPLFAASAALAPLFMKSVYAVEIDGFPSTISCDGDTFFGCADIPESTCCAFFPTGFGFSVGFFGLPAGTEGQGFRDTANACVSPFGNVFGPGDKCLNGGGVDRAVSASFFPVGTARREAAGPCRQPNRFSFVDENGKAVKIKFPEGKAEEIATLHKQKAFKELAQFEKVATA